MKEIRVEIKTEGLKEGRKIIVDVAQPTLMLPSLMRQEKN